MLNDENESIEQAVYDITDMLNKYGSHKSVLYFVKRMANEHRTLQQLFTNICLTWFKHLANTEYYDLRNEDSIMLARAIQPAIEQHTKGADSLSFI